MAAQMSPAPSGFPKQPGQCGIQAATMSLSLAQLLVGLAAFYAAAGALFAGPFVFRGLERIDPLGAGSPWSFRLLIVPGTIAFWPLLLLRWAAGSIAPPVEATAHRRAAR
jgi:hypothetical protein